MATAKKETKSVRLVAPNGAIVSVSAEMAERLLGGGGYSAAPSSHAAKK